MDRYKLILSTLLILLASFAANAQGRLALTWEVLKYDINATLPQNFTADRDLDVKAVLNLKNISSSSSSTVTLRISDQAEVSSVKVGGADADFRKSEEKIGGNRSLQKLVTRVSAVPPGQNISLTVDYKLKVTANSGLNSLSPVNSQFLPLAHWYPTPTSWYFPGGADFAPYTLKVNGAGADSKVISSGTQTAEGFEQKINGQPFFITGHWDKIDAGGVEVFVPKGMNANSAIAGNLAELASEAKAHTAKLLGRSFDAPLRIVGVSRGSGFADGGTIFVDENVFQRDKVDSQTAGDLIESIVKIWLGNIYKIQNDGYGVIREGLARHIATEFIGQKYGTAEAELERLRQRTNYSAISQRDVPLNIVSPVDAYYYTATANKGAMIWNYLAGTFGDDFFPRIRTQAEDAELTLPELRAAFSTQKDYLDYLIERITEMNLMIGLPQQNGNQTKVALRNLSDIDVNVEVVATTADGQKIRNKAPVKAKSFGEAIFNSPGKIVRVEVDADKIYPQTDYSDDIAPREIGDNDALVYIKKEFDRQRFADAEKNARAVLDVYPNFDDARILLARAQLAQGKITDAQRNYEEVLNLKLPTAQSLAWAHVGLGEIAQKSGQNPAAARHFEQAIRSNSELGATLTARRGRDRLGTINNVEAGIKTFFSNFDKAVSANSKSEIDAMVVSGEIARFAGNVAGQAQQWSTQIMQVDKIDENNIWIEANMTIKLLNREVETGMAVYRLSKVGDEWKLSGVEIFEVS
jgi:tetratricopeptide (TPR) repeat protein